MLYTGVVKKKSVKDPTKYLIECAEAFEVHEVDARLSEDIKPQNVGIGDTIRFTLDEEAPEVTWAENVKGTTQKAEDAAPEAVPEEEYIGTVTKQSAKQPSLYMVDCPVVTEWYKTEARLPEKLWPFDLKLGGTIRFRIKETSQGRPLISWAEVEETKESRKKAKAERKAKAEEEKVKGEEPAAKKAKVEKGKGKGKKDEGPSAEVRMEDAEGALAAWELDGTKIGGSPISVKTHSTSSDGLKFQVTGFGPQTDFRDIKEHFQKAGGVAFCKVFSKEKEAANTRVIGEVRFLDVETTEAALSLYGSVLEGNELRVELDGRSEDGTKVKVWGLPIGFERKTLKKHFEDNGYEVAFCKIIELKNDW